MESTRLISYNPCQVHPSIIFDIADINKNVNPSRFQKDATSFFKEI